MASLTVQALAVIAAGMLVGNEFCISAFVHPRLRALEDAAHAASAQAVARVLGAVMPFWYAAVLLLTSGVAFLLRGAGAVPLRLACLSAALWLVSIVYTVAALAPINTQVAGWDRDHLPGDWKALRLRWDRRHAVRVVLLFVALACLVAACLTARAASV